MFILAFYFAGVCQVWANSHYLTFDGQTYNFINNCSYYLVKEMVTKYNLTIIVKYDCDTSNSTYCPRSLIVLYGSSHLVFTQLETSELAVSSDTNFYSFGFFSHSISCLLCLFWRHCLDNHFLLMLCNAGEHCIQFKIVTFLKKMNLSIFEAQVLYKKCIRTQLKSVLKWTYLVNYIVQVHTKKSFQQFKYSRHAICSLHPWTRWHDALLGSNSSVLCSLSSSYRCIWIKDACTPPGPLVSCTSQAQAWRSHWFYQQSILRWSTLAQQLPSNFQRTSLVGKLRDSVVSSWTSAMNYWVIKYYSKLSQNPSYCLIVGFRDLPPLKGHLLSNQ